MTRRTKEEIQAEKSAKAARKSEAEAAIERAREVAAKARTMLGIEGLQPKKAIEYYGRTPVSNARHAVCRFLVDRFYPQVTKAECGRIAGFYGYPGDFIWRDGEVRRQGGLSYELLKKAEERGEL